MLRFLIHINLQFVIQARIPATLRALSMIIRQVVPALWNARQDCKGGARLLASSAISMTISSRMSDSVPLNPRVLLRYLFKGVNTSLRCSSTVVEHNVLHLVPRITSRINLLIGLMICLLATQLRQRRVWIHFVGIQVDLDVVHFLITAVVVCFLLLNK